MLVFPGPGMDNARCSHSKVYPLKTFNEAFNKLQVLKDPLDQYCTIFLEMTCW